MQVEVTDIHGSRMAEIRTPVGDLTAHWCGKPDDAPGTYTVEWTIDTELAWGQNAHPAPAPGPALLTDGDHTVLRGRLDVTVDGIGVLHLGRLHGHPRGDRPLPVLSVARTGEDHTPNHCSAP
jgi:hypothetical protein